MTTFVNQLIIRRNPVSGFIMDFGYTSGESREAMLKDFMDNVRVDGFEPGEEIKDFLLTKAQDGDVLEKLTDCGNYKITVKFFLA